MSRLTILLLSISIFLIPVICQADVLSFSQTIYIPGHYFSLMNFTYDIGKLDDQFDIDIQYQLTQTAYHNQGNSLYDIFLIDSHQYAQKMPCYVSAIKYLTSLYDSYQPCQGGCNFNAESWTKQQSTSFKIINDFSPNISLVIDNTVYPCNSGTYQSEIYLYQTIVLSIESNLNFSLIINIVFVVLLQILVFLFAYIMIMINKLSNKKKKLKRLRELREDQDVLLFQKERM